MTARQPFDLQTASEFLVIAAILVELKSRKLLPGPDDVEDDEELAGFEERDRLLARLLELQAYAAAADAFAVLIDRARRTLPRVAGLDERFRDLAPDLLAGVTPERLAAAFMVGTVPRPELVLDLSHVTVEAVTVSEAVAELEERLPADGRLSFRELTAHCTHPHADHRALPRPARAVQAGLGHPRPGRDLRRPGRRVGPATRPCCPPSAVATRSRSTTAEGLAMGLPEEHRAIEAVLLSAVEPVPPNMLAELLEMPIERVEAACAELAAGYEAEGRGFVLARVAGGYRYQTHPDMAPFVERFAMEGVSSRLSSAALETLAIVAYRQPVSRAQIAALRGRERGRRRAPARAARLHQRRRATRRARDSPSSTAPRLRSWRSWGSTASSELPPVEELLPGPEVVEQLEERLRPGADA